MKKERQTAFIVAFLLLGISATSFAKPREDGSPFTKTEGAPRPHESPTEAFRRLSFHKAQREYVSGQFLTAELRTKVLRDIYPYDSSHDARYLRMIGRCMLEQGRCEEALEYLTARYQPGLETLLDTEIALCHLWLGNTRQARVMNSGLSLAHQSQIDETALPPLDSENGLEIHLLVKRGLMRHGAFRELAVDDFKKAFSYAPDNAEIAQVLEMLVPPGETLPHAAVMVVYGSGDVRHRGERRLTGFSKEVAEEAIKRAKKAGRPGN